MYAQQINVPAENNPGILAQVTSVLARQKINLRAITISSFGEHGFFNLLVDDPHTAVKALVKEGFNAKLKDVIAVLIEDQPGGLDKVVKALASEQINIDNAYGFVLESFKNAVFVLEVDRLERAMDILHHQGFKTLDSDTLNAVEPFHYMKY